MRPNYVTIELNAFAELLGVARCKQEHETNGTTKRDIVFKMGEQTTRNATIADNAWIAD